MGRPSKYTPELIEAICERLSKGEPLAAICRDEGMPHVSTLWRWAEEDSEQGRDISQRVARARDDGFESIAVDCLQIIDSEPSIVPSTGAKDSADVSWKKARAETRLKLLACWNPKRYGNKVDVTSGGDKLPQVTVNVPPLPDGGPEQ